MGRTILPSRFGGIAIPQASTFSFSSSFHERERGKKRNWVLTASHSPTPVKEVFSAEGRAGRLGSRYKPRFFLRGGWSAGWLNRSGDARRTSEGSGPSCSAERQLSPAPA